MTRAHVERVTRGLQESGWTVEQTTRSAIGQKEPDDWKYRGPNKDAVILVPIEWNQLIEWHDKLAGFRAQADDFSGEAYHKTRAAHLRKRKSEIYG